MQKPPPYYFYFIESFAAYAVAYPLAILVLLRAVFHLNFSPSTQFLKKLLGWVLIVLIGLSIPADKKIRYILPAMPALALIGGYLFIVAHDRRYLYAVKQGFVRFSLLVPLLGILAAMAMHRVHPEVHFAYYPALISLGVLLGVMILVHRRDLFVLATAVLSFFAMVIFIIEPININLNKSKAFVLQVEALRADHKSKLVFYRQGRDGLVIKYLANMPEQSEPLFIKDEASLKKIKKGMMVVSTEENYQQLPKKLLNKFQVLQQGRLGRESIVVFVRK